MDHNEMMDWLEALESEHDQILRADQPTMVYLDGVGFRHITRYLEKPFDFRFHDAMVETSRRLAHNFGINFIMTASDEIAMVRFSRDERFSIWCGQSRDRILSSVSSMASSMLFQACSDLGMKLAWHPSFAGHVWNAPTFDAAAQSLLCIEHRQHARSVSNLANHYLGRQTESVSISEIKTKLAEAGHPWESMPSKFKHGTAFRREFSKTRNMKFDLKIVQKPLFYRQDLQSDIFSET